MVVLLLRVLGFGVLACLQIAQVLVQSLEALLPRAPRVLGPYRDLLERFRSQPTRPALRISPPRDQPSLLEHPQVARDRRKTDVEGGRQLEHGGVARREALDD